MDFIIYFDIAAGILTSFLIGSVIVRNQFRGTSNKFFVALAVYTLVSTLFDILASLPQFDKTTLFVFNTFYIFFRAAIPMLFFLYAAAIGEVYHRFKKRGVAIFSTTFIPYLLVLICLIVNIWTKSMFDYVDGPRYVRGHLIWITYVSSFIYGAGSIGVLIASRKIRGAAQLSAALSAFFFQVAATVMQIFVGNILIEMFATAFSLIILTVFIENPENFIDDKTKHPGFSAFVTDAKRKIDQKEPFGAVFIHATNSSTAYSLFPYREFIEFIRYSSNTLAEQCRKIDRTSVVYYLGQSSYVYLFADKSKSKALLELITDYFDAPMSHGDITFRFNAKIALAENPEDISDLQSLVAFSTTFYDLGEENDIDVTPYRTAAGNTLFELDKILEKAIAEKSFSLLYQPIYSVKEKRFISAEALLRLNDETFGTIMPALMIPYAEKHGKIGAIGDIVLEKSFAFLSERIGDKLDYLEVNLSSMQLVDVNILPHIQELSRKYGVDPSRVIFEITESVAIMDNPVVLDNIDAIFNAGYRIAIDDFGTGYSNIARLIRLPYVTLKFDKSMADELVSNDNDPFFQGLFDMTHRGHVNVLLEGVETKALVDKVEKMGVDFIQGYYYSKPLNEDALLEFLAEAKK